MMFNILKELGCTIKNIRENDKDDWFSVDNILVAMPSGERVVFSQRTYRDGLHITRNVTDEEIEAVIKDEWYLWNSERSNFSDYDFDGLVSDE